MVDAVSGLKLSLPRAGSQVYCLLPEILINEVIKSRCTHLVRA